MRGLLERDERKSMEAGRKKRFQSGMNGRAEFRNGTVDSIWGNDEKVLKKRKLA
jgi:hypothetical protein